MKKTLICFLLIAIFVIGLFTLSACTDTGDLWITSAEISAVLDENGTLTVDETWNVKTTSEEGYRNLYRTIATYDEKFGRTSEFVFGGAKNPVTGKTYPVEDAVRNMENEQSYEYNVSHYQNTSYAIGNSSGNYEIGVILPKLTRGDTTTVTFSYLFKDFAGSYADIAELDWKPYSSDFQMFIEKLTMTITMPASVNYADESNTFAWLHCTAESNLSLQNNVMTITASSIAAGTGVGVHSLVPTSSFTGLNKTSVANKKAALLEQEDEWQAAYLKQQHLLAVLGIVDIIGSISLVVIALILVVLSRRFGPYRNKNKEYLREIPEDWTAAGMGEFFYYYKGGAQKHAGAILSATMLDLARRDYLDIIPDEKENYLIEVCAVPQAKKDDLRNFEKDLMILLSKVQESNGGNAFSMKYFEKFAKKNVSFVDKTMRAFMQKAGAKFIRSKYVGKYNFWYVICILFGLFSFLCAVLAFTALGKYFAYLFYGGAIAGFLTVFGSFKTPKLTPEGEKIHAQTIALRDYMLDFSNLREYDVPQLKLWEEYLVYATMMGISEKVVKQLKLVYKELQTPNFDSSYYRRGYLYSYIFLSSRTNFGGKPAFDLGNHMQSAIRNANAFASAQQMAKNSKGFGGGFGGHGGGGFSGGGGFGGGGGGGRH
ncbi:MAG: DUF2207 domain-containing protein [Clostridia bacterium]|nr:DUF2207 domain-containing protein [Clostridia bacterium]